MPASDQAADPVIDPEWTTGLPAADLPAVRALFAAVLAHDGIGPAADHHLSPTEDYLAARDEHDTVVGLAWGSAADPAELLVHPDHRRRGIGRSLLTRLRDRGDQGVWAHGDQPPARALADGAGLTPRREMYQLRRSLPADAFAVELPEGVRIRTFRPGADEEQFLGVNSRAFSWHPEQGRLDLAGLTDQMAEDWFDPAGFLLAVDEHDTVLGFHWTKVHRVDPTPHDGPAVAVGEVYVLGVDPRSPIRRLGRPLTVAGLEHLAAQGLPAVLLYVESDNAPALALYRALDFTPWHSDVVYG